jgi:exopolysaccharide biosynthesis polyprenyl glycosylphosphotransferase
LELFLVERNETLLNGKYNKHMSFSVLLSVYSKENPKYLDEALCSIWDHQTLKPGQIVLVKDGSLTDELNNCINVWKQKLNETLTIVGLPENVGLGAALNAGLQECRYELVARMDTDDISLPYRFEKQVSFMNENPDIAASSAILEEWDETFSEYIGMRILPLKPEELKKFSKYRCPLSHPLAIYRKLIILTLGGYPDLKNAQDHPLWSLLLVKGYKLANLPDVLLKMRTGKDLMKRRNISFFKKEIKMLNYQRSIRAINFYEYLRNMLVRFFFRASPGFIKKMLYKYRHLRKYQFLILFTDIVLLFVAVFISFCVRELGIPPIERILRVMPHFIPIVSMWIICFLIAGFYSSKIPKMGYRLFSNISIIAIVCTLLGFGYFYLNLGFERGPRTILAIYAFVATALIALWRLSLNKIAKKYTAKLNIAFIGVNNAVIDLLQYMQNNSTMRCKAQFVYNENNPQDNYLYNVQILKTPAAFVEEIIKGKVDMLVLADERIAQTVKDMSFLLTRHSVDLINASDFNELFMNRIAVETFNELDFFRHIQSHSKKIYRIIKQIIDVLTATALLAATLPLWPFFMLLIKINSPGPVFVKQEKTGYLGRSFTSIKFRTKKAGQDDSQITIVGKFMRKTRIDEIPQFINIIKSDMSFIGPRPERPELVLELEKQVPFYRQRLLVKPGVSCWDQISGEYHSPSKEDTYKKLQYDLYYIKNMSLFLDISIFFKTLITIAKRSGV